MLTASSAMLHAEAPTKQSTVDLSYMDYDRLISMGFPFTPVDRVTCADEQLRYKVERSSVERGTPIVISGWHEHPNWTAELFTFHWIQHHFGDSTILCRDLRTADDVTMTMNEYVKTVHPDNALKDLTQEDDADVMVPQLGVGTAPDDMLFDIKVETQLETIADIQSKLQQETGADKPQQETMQETPRQSTAPDAKTISSTIPKPKIRRRRTRRNPNEEQSEDDSHDDDYRPSITAAKAQNKSRRGINKDVVEESIPQTAPPPSPPSPSPPQRGRKHHNQPPVADRQTSFPPVTSPPTIQNVPESSPLLYAKDVTCPSPWRTYLETFLPSWMTHLGENDLVANVLPARAAENLMIYVGTNGTWTPAHFDQCGAIGHNLMAWAEDDSYSIWFMVRAKDKEKAEALWKTFGHPLEYEGYFASIEDLKQADFPIYVVEQKRGDFVIVPSQSYHQVVNMGKATIKVSWNRVTAHCLEGSIRTVLPRYSEIFRPESYRMKLIVHSTLQEWEHILRENLQLPLPPPSFCDDFRTIIQLFRKIVEEDWIDLDQVQREFPTVKFIKPRRLPEAIPALCDFCNADLWNRQFQCPECGEEDEGYDICTFCYIQGRGCEHRATSLEMVESFSIGSCRRLFSDAVRAWNESEILIGEAKYSPMNDPWMDGITGPPDQKASHATTAYLRLMQLRELKPCLWDHYDLKWHTVAGLKNGWECPVCAKTCPCGLCAAGDPDLQLQFRKRHRSPVFWFSRPDDQPKNRGGVSDNMIKTFTRKDRYFFDSDGELTTTTRSTRRTSAKRVSQKERNGTTTTTSSSSSSSQSTTARRSRAKRAKLENKTLVDEDYPRQEQDQRLQGQLSPQQQLHPQIRPSFAGNDGSRSSVSRQQFAGMLSKPSDTMFQTLRNFGCTRTLETIAEIESEEGAYYSALFQVEACLHQRGPAYQRALDVFRKEMLENYRRRRIDAYSNAPDSPDNYGVEVEDVEGNEDQEEEVDVGGEGEVEQIQNGEEQIQNAEEEEGAPENDQHQRTHRTLSSSLDI
ncbi:hypothetical protein BG004_005312 [Podila humilis]|nr:hypothetical protein BG004_005312 [Podila humilis]